jgi:tripartite-type tricarboxylate transporter receptor subunit TctC
MSGEASVMFMPTTNAVPLVKSGRLRALAVTSRVRIPALPSLPTVAESGLKDYESSQWYGLLAPAGTPADILNVLSSHVMKIMQAPDMKQRMIDSGSISVGNTREAFRSHIKMEFDKWARVIKQSGARVD